MPTKCEHKFKVAHYRFVADMRREQCENEAQLAECTANARLIAAAPDMLEALERLLKSPDLNLECCAAETIDAIVQANNIVSKAKGGKS